MKICRPFLTLLVYCGVLFLLYAKLCYSFSGNTRLKLDKIYLPIKWVILLSRMVERQSGVPSTPDRVHRTG